MLSVTRISPGDGYRYVMEQVAAGRHDMRPPTDGGPTPYYMDHTARGESPGWWAGNGATVLGVEGRVTERQMRYLIGQGRHPVSGYQLGQRWRTYAEMTDAYRERAVQRALAALPADATVEQADKIWHDIMTAPERHAVSAYDVTVSPVKSVSLLWAFGDDDVKRDVVAAHHAGVRSMLDHLQRHGAYTRVGAGGLRQLDTAGLTALAFDHRMSRERDPQLHTHVVVSAKVLASRRDGGPQWLALDGRAFYRATISARVAYERAVEGELYRLRGITFAPRGDAAVREIVGFSDASLRHYSKRRGAITAHLDRRVQHPSNADRSPSARWRRRAQDATLRTRRPHRGTETTREAVRRWHAEDRRARLDTAGQVQAILTGRARGDPTSALARHVLRRARALARDPASVDENALRAAAAGIGITGERQDHVVDAAVRADPRLAVTRAVRDLGRDRAVFHRDHLELAIGRVLDVQAGTSTAEDWQRVQALAERAITEPAYGLRVLNPPSPVQWGEELLRVSDRASEYTRHRDLALTTTTVLAAEKEFIAYAARRGAQPAPAETIDATATAMALSPEQSRALRHLIGDSRRVTGVIGPAGTGKTYLQRAVVAAARLAGAPVIGLTVGQAAATLLADATVQADGSRLRTENIARWLHAQDRPPVGTLAADWQFQPGQWVIVDEASQVSSHDLARLVTLLDRVAGKLILVGDPEQIGAVGPGGLFRYLAALTNSVQLTHVHRFTAQWEGPASLRLRAGDPTVLAEYDRRGRLIGGHRAQLTGQMIDRWAADLAAGRHTVMLVETTAEATDIARQARDVLVRGGLVSPGPAVQLHDGNHASVGDLIISRRNDRRLVTGDTFVSNRDQWRIQAVTATGDLLVLNTRTATSTVLPHGYAAAHVQLAYALTVDSAQGITVHAARALIDDNTPLARLYVMLTRGAALNEAYVVTDDHPREGTPPRPATARVAVFADIMRRATPHRSATETEQHLWADIDALHTWTPIYDDLTARARIPEYLTAVRRIAGPALANRLTHDLALPALITRLTTLHEAGHDPTDVLRTAIRPRELDSADDIAAVLSWRIDRLTQHVTADPIIATAPAQTGTYTQRLPANLSGDIGDVLRQIAAVCDRRVDALAHLAAQHRPAWTRPLGEIPTDRAGRQQWHARAAAVAAYRDRYQITSDHPIGAEPSTRDITRWNAWHRARLALGAATLAGRLTTIDDTELHRLMAAQRAAETTAPPYVADQLRSAHLALSDAEQRNQDLNLLLTAADTAAHRARQHIRAYRPRWWQHGPSRTRLVAAQTTARHRLNDATAHASGLRAALERTASTIAKRRAHVERLETQHATWRSWYANTLPTRYAGLAAATEQARRDADRHDRLADAVARVHAIDSTRPQPHVKPLPNQLPQHAAAARHRTDTPAIDRANETEID